MFPNPFSYYSLISHPLTHPTPNTKFECHYFNLVLRAFLHRTYFPKVGCCNSLWIMNMKGHITLKLSVYSYGCPLSIDTKISTIHCCMTSLWRHKVSTSLRNFHFLFKIEEKFDFCVKTSCQHAIFMCCLLTKLENDNSNLQTKCWLHITSNIYNNQILKSRDCINPLTSQLWKLTPLLG